MRILLVGEASNFHNSVKTGLKALGHDVKLMASGRPGWRDFPRDIDVNRNMQWGKLGGLSVLWKLLKALPKLIGNDVVQLHNYQLVPLGMWWNRHLIRFLSRHNKHLVMCSIGDDPLILMRQFKGFPAYSEIYWDGKPQNIKLHSARLAEQVYPPVVACWKEAIMHADAIVPVLYEYYVGYNIAPYKDILHYVALAISIPEKATPREFKNNRPIKVLVGIQSDRDYIKGASVIADWVDEVAKASNGSIEVTRVSDVPYDEYCRMLEETDVLVDQLYSYTPSMNSLAAMARGTVVIGGGEEEFYEFIGEKTLCPIINVRPDNAEQSIITLREKLTSDSIAELSRQSIEFVKKHHAPEKVAHDLEVLYGSL